MPLTPDSLGLGGVGLFWATSGNWEQVVDHSCDLIASPHQRAGGSLLNCAIARSMRFNATREAPASEKERWGWASSGIQSLGLFGA